MKITSPAFSDGGTIPDQYGYTAENVNPPLKIDDIPPEAESLALIMDDPDAFKEPDKAWDHWIAWNIDPDTKEIPEDSVPSGAVEGKTDFGKTGYGGPNPPSDVHNYRFKIFALDTEIDLPENSTKSDLVERIEKHVIDSAQLTGNYAPWQSQKG